MIKKYLALVLSATTAVLTFTGVTASGFTSVPEPIEIVSMRSECEKY